jgi:NADP-dependent 3-hydroxy acid dehydrogenase YdfG
LCYDVRDKEAGNIAIHSLPPEWQSIDVLLNNAGLAAGRDFFDEASMEDWETMIDTNIKGLLYTTRALLPMLKKAANPHIINIGSTAGKEAYEKGNVYCATKFAVNALSQSMRIELLKHKIKSTVINPGAVLTEFSMVRLKGDQALADKVYEGYKPLSPEDVAETIYFVAAQPAHVCLNEIVMTSTAQANSFYLYKDL